MREGIRMEKIGYIGVQENNESTMHLRSQCKGTVNY